METTRSLTEIIDGVTTEMRRLDYAEATIKDFAWHAAHFKEYVITTTSADTYSEEIGQLYLKHTIGFPFNEARPLDYKEAAYLRCIHKIGEFHVHGTCVKEAKRKYPPIEIWGLNDIEIIQAYLEAMQTADNSDATKLLRMNHIRKFYVFLWSRSLSGVGAVSEKLIHDYVKYLQGYSPVFVKHMLGTLRNYFRFLYKMNYVDKDWSFSVPKVTVAKNSNIPELWDKDKIEKVLQSIDRGNPTGKRNYAIIMVVAELGLRISDISSLTLRSLKWESYEIDYVQHKTKKRVVQPISNETGWAIIDYLRNGRQNVDLPYVFLTSNAPYTQMSTGAIGSILDRAMKKCGLKKKDGIASGMHSLRHSLARRLLEDGTELNVVADIMGHSGYCSTSPYLKVDIDGLRECALSLNDGGNTNAE